VSSYCPDCGERACSRGACSNCQEELYILENQSDVIEEPLSDGFMQTAAEQQDYLRKRLQSVSLEGQ
jgi:hypothetical protein